MVRRWVRRAGIFVAVIIILLIGVVLFLHTSAGKSVVRNKLQSFLQEKWKTEVFIQKVNYRLPNWIAIEGLTILDAKKDTVLSGGRLYVGIKMLQLLSNKVEVTALILDDISLYCHRGKNDTAFNFQFILDAFAPASTDTMSNPEVAPMHLSVKELRLKNVRMNYEDQKGEFYFTAFIRNLSALPSSIRPEKTEFNLHNFSLQNTDVVMIDSSAAGSTIETNSAGNSDPSPLLMALEKLQLQNVTFSYKQPLLKTEYNFRVSDMYLSQVLFDLAGKEIIVQNLELNRSSARLYSSSPSQKEIQKRVEALPAINNEEWKFAVNTISLTDNSFLSQNAAAPRNSGLDFEHIDAQKINLFSKNNSFDSSGFAADVSSVSLHYNNQLHLKQASANLRMADHILYVQDLTTEFNQSLVKIDGDVSWPVNPDNTSQFRIEDLSVYYGDLLWIQPALKELLPVSLQLNDRIMLRGNFSGTPKGIKAEQLTLSLSGKQMQLMGDVDIKMEKGEKTISANFQQLQLKKQLLSKDLLQQLVKKNIHLPEELSLTGRVHLNSRRMVTDLNLSSSYGELQINGTAANIQNPHQLTYRFALDANHFETGKWMGSDSVFGKITGRILVNGTGVDPKKMISTAQLQLGSAVINNYPFQNVQLQAGVSKGKFMVRSNIHDPNLETSINLDGHLLPGLAVKGTIDVVNADLFKLGLISDSLQYSGNIYVDASYDMSGKIDALLQADNNIVGVHGRKILTDSIILTGRADSDTLQVNFHAPFMDAQLAGNYPVDSLAPALSSFWKVIYPLQHEPSGKNTRLYTTQHSSLLDVTIRQDSLLKSFFPKLDLKQPLKLRAKYAPGEGEYTLGFQLTAPDLTYGNMEVRGWEAKAKTIDSIVQFSVTGSELWIGNQKLNGADISGEIQKGLLTVKSMVNDSAGKKYFGAHVKLEKGKNGMTLRFLDDLTLNRNQWIVSPENAIQFIENGLVIHQFQLESRGQRIIVSTKEEQLLAPIDIRLDNFDLSYISRLLFPADSIGVSGIINADLSIRQPLDKIPVVTGDIRSTDLSLFNIPLGNFQFHSENINDSLLFKGGLSGVNQLDFNGGLHLKDKGVYFHSQLQKLDMEIIKMFTKDIFAHLSGKITGNLGLAGSLVSPRYKGVMYLDATRFSLMALNTIYRIDKQKLLIDHPDLRLENFIVSDSMGNKLNITGSLGLFNPVDKNIDLAVETKDFLWLNAKRSPEVSLYGKGIIDATISIKGTIDAPVIVGDAYLQKNSEIYLVSSTKSKVRKTRTDGIMFVDIDTIGSVNSIVDEPAVDSVVTQKMMKGLKYDLDLKVDKDAKFSMVIDPTNSDELLMSGDARLKAGVGDNGKVGIEGVYNLQSGYYKINNLLLRGKFLLVKGSSISFSGNPSLAEADVTTEYIVEASPKGLLNYKDGDDAAYSQRVPFGVIFMIKGPLSKPALSFDIQLKSGKGVLKSSVKSDVEHALDRLRTDVTEMNKQVFSLLLTKRFSVTSDNNTLENTNLNANNALKEGVSSFLSEAMNQVADQLITGVDVEVNMKTYKTDDDPISKTDLGVAVSKGLMEDRLVIRIEENFPMGNTSAPVKSGSQYIPDITSTYKLSKDGRLQLQGYQRNEYDAVVQGYFTEIGVSFIIEVSYDKFNELLRRRKNLADEKK